MKGGLVNPKTLRCPVHDKGGKAWLLNNARKGGEATRRRWRLDLKLPPLDSFEAAQKWKELAGRAVAEGGLDGKAAQAIVAAAREWQKSDEEMRRLQERIRQLEKRLGE